MVYKIIYEELRRLQASQFTFSSKLVFQGVFQNFILQEIGFIGKLLLEKLFTNHRPYSLGDPDM